MSEAQKGTLRLLWADPVRRILSLNSLISSFGSGLFLAASVIYFVRIVGFAEAQVGVALSLAALVGFITTVPMGHLAERFGLRRTLVAIAAYRGIGYIFYLFVTEYWQFLLVACLLYIADRGGPAINQAMVAAIMPGHTMTRTMGLIRSIRNAGLTLGFLMAGLAIQSNSETAFRLLIIGNALSFFVSAFLIRRLPNPPIPQRDDETPKSTERPWRNKRLVGLTLINGPLYLHDTLFMIVLPLWIVSNTQAPPWSVTLMLTLNTILAVALQVRTTSFADTYGKARWALPISGIALAAACAAYSGSGMDIGATGAFTLLLVGTLLITVSELLHSAAGWQLSFELSPKDRKTPHLAFFGLSFSAEEIAGPALAMYLLVATGAWSWLIIGGFVLLVSLISPWVVRKAPDADRMDATTVLT